MEILRLVRFFGLASALILTFRLAPAAQEPALEPLSLERASELRLAGDWAGAEAILRQTWTASSGEDKTPALALGNLLLMEGNVGDAEAPLREAADSKGPLAPYGALLLARCRLAQGDAGEARKLLAPLLSSEGSERLAEEAAKLDAEALEREGRPSEAASAWQKMLDEKGRRSQEGALRLRMAQALESAGAWPRAAAEYRRLYLDPKSPFGRAAGLALARLAAKGHGRQERLTARQELDLARRFLAAGRREDAFELLSGLPDLRGPEALEASYLRVATLYALRDNAACAREADSMLEKFGPRKPVLQALLKAAWASLRTGNHGEVVRRCQKLLDLCGKEQALCAEALHCWGTSAYTRGLFADAIGRFEAAETLKAPPAMTASILYKKAWCLYRLERYSDARAAFSLASRAGGRGLAPPCSFASALAALRGGDRAAFLDGMVLLAFERPGYWSWRAREALAAQGVPLAESPPSDPVLPAWDPALAGPQASLARSLDLSGLEGFAAEAIQPALRTRGKEPGAAYTYALLLARSGRYGAAQATMARAFGPRIASFACPPYLMEPFFPTPDLHWVRLEAQRASTDPALVLAVTRQESFFDERALSPAGAQGLMQIMPETARALSGQEPSGDLLDPSRNLALGAKYLARLTAQFPLPAAVAAYNAGEEVVGRWASAFGAVEPEEFVGMIPYQETREYTAQVLWNLHVYRRILGESDEGMK